RFRACNQRLLRCTLDFEPATRDYCVALSISSLQPEIIALHSRFRACNQRLLRCTLDFEPATRDYCVAQKNKKTAPGSSQSTRCGSKKPSCKTYAMPTASTHA